MKILLTLCFFLFVEMISAQSGVLRTLLKEESQVLSVATKSGLNDVRVLRSSSIAYRKTIENHQSLLKKFWGQNKEQIKEIAESIGEEAFSNGLEETVKISFYLNEIVQNKNYPTLYKAICKKLHVSSASKVDIIVLLIGQEVQNLTIKPEKLYQIFFLMSDQFALEEMNGMLRSTECSSERANKIFQIASSRKLELNKELCIQPQKKKNDGDAFAGILLLSGMGYLTYRIYRFIRKIRNNQQAP
jgi:hypothetical protein